jgi:TonB family protein
MDEMTQVAESGARREMFAERREPARSPLAAALSLTTHAALVVAAAVFAYRGVVTPDANGRPPMRYVELAAPPTVPVELLLPPVPPPDPPKVELEAPKPAPDPKVEPVVIETAKAPEPPPPPPKPEPPAPPKPEVNVGAFASAKPAATATQPPRQVQTTAFDTPAAVAPDMRLKQTATGLFDAGSDMAARPGTDKPKGVVTGTGFDQQAAAATPSTGRALAVTGGGFDTTRQTTTASRPQAVQASGFGDVKPVAPQQTAVAAAGPPTTPVEVLFKPAPAYTAEAKAKGIQGDVVLEVEFLASGSLKVVRVVRGLGSGLDELASDAARQIKFKPALQSGKPVDFRANVVIVFRLS